MHLTSIKQENSTEISSLKLNLYSKKIGAYSSLQRNLENKQNYCNNIINIYLRQKNISCIESLFYDYSVFLTFMKLKTVDYL